MKRQNFSKEFKQQILEECREVGNVSLVARRHEISKHTIYAWIKTSNEKGAPEKLPRKQAEQNTELLSRLEKVSTENDILKKLVAEKELELAILKDLRDRVNPR